MPTDRRRPRDLGYMRLALEAAERRRGFTSPNPTVGAVIVRRGKVLAVGHHERAGADHAEVAALRQLDFSAEGAELYSTLEPCCHRGRTGPCTEAIVRAGIRRVVVGTIDPNPKVSGRGVARLRRAGIEVVVGVLEAECAAQNEPFNFAIVNDRPLVVAKIAASLDGKVASAAGESRFITGEGARRDGRRLRGELPAILVGVGTVLADDPNLTTRIPGRPDPLRVILDGRLRTPPTAAVARTARTTPTLVFTSPKAPAARARRLEALGVEIVRVQTNDRGRIDLASCLRELYRRGVVGVLVEGGPTVIGAFVDEALVDRVVVYLAPLLLGGARARSSVEGEGRRLADALRLGPLEPRAIGDDLLLSARVERGAGRR